MEGGNLVEEGLWDPQAMWVQVKESGSRYYDARDEIGQQDFEFRKE